MHIRINNSLVKFPEPPTSEDIYIAKVNENNEGYWEIDFKKYIDVKIREPRKILLEEADILINKAFDNNLTTDLEECKTYRQALRDATKGLTTQADVDSYKFPEKPLI